jgi:hypothetical protein
VYCKPEIDGKISQKKLPDPFIGRQRLQPWANWAAGLIPGANYWPKIGKGIAPMA